MYYKASLDKLSKIVSISIALLFVVIIVILPLTLPVGGSSLPAIGSGIFFVLIYLLVWLYSTTGYTLTTDALAVKRVMGTVTLPRAEIESMRSLERDELRGTIRTFGVGGLFGYYGKFYNSTLGKMTWYMTNTSNAVMIRMKNGKVYLISPDERQAFLNESGN